MVRCLSTAAALALASTASYAALPPQVTLPADPGACCPCGPGCTCPVGTCPDGCAATLAFIAADLVQACNGRECFVMERSEAVRLGWKISELPKADAPKFLPVPGAAKAAAAPPATAPVAASAGGCSGAEFFTDAGPRHPLRAVAHAVGAWVEQHRPHLFGHRRGCR